MSFPSKFGKYLLLERVNVGGMAEVFKAKTVGVAGFERILAIKRILPNLVEDDEFIRMFIDEARIAVQLNHANIVQIYELGKHGEHYYIAMEYIPSRDLRGILDRLRSSGQLMPIPQAAYITAKTAEALDYAHRRKDPQGSPMNIIHRDVSPQNVLIGYEGEVKVIDFGIAKAANRASKTQAGVLKGKFGYMSPEQVRGLPIDRRSDIFAVGVLLYEMLTGERLFIGESDFSTLERVRNADVIPPTSFNKKISPQLEQVVLKTLAREVEDRYQWASELAQDLQGFMADNAGAFNARRLSMSMKEVYAPEVASERSKLEEFLRINPDDVKERGGPQTSTVMPLPRPAATPSTPSIRNRPAPDDDDGGEEFGEDKTFVIEASVAGMALGQQRTDPHIAARITSNLPKAQPPISADDGDSPENADAAGSDDVSLYGGNQDSEEDDARTLVGADNPYFNPSPGLVVKPVDEPLPVVRTPTPARALVTPQPPIFDPVMAAMLDEDRSRYSGSPMLPRPQLESSEASTLRPGGQLAARPANALKGLASEDTGPQMASRPDAATQEADGPFSLVPGTTANGDEPINWRPLVAALGGSGALFLGAIAFFAFRLIGSGEQTPAELVLTPVGAPVPSEVRIILDGAQVGTRLPATLPLPSGEHRLEVSAKAMVTVSRAVAGTGGTVRQPVFIVLNSVEPAEPPAQPDTPTSPAVPVAILPVPDPPTVPAVEGGWRLSLAAIADDGVPVAGAEVLVNGTALGLTPFESELDPALDVISLKVRKDGFVTHEMDFTRAGRPTIGPATVSLKRMKSTQAAAPAPDVKVAALPSPPNDAAPKPEPIKAEVPPVPAKGDIKDPVVPKAAEVEPKEVHTPQKPVAEIQLGTSPYAETIIDGRKYGSTPFFGPRKLTLQIGTHKVEFFDKQNNKKYKYQIKLKAQDPNNKIVIQFNKNDPPKVEGQVELKRLD